MRNGETKQMDPWITGWWFQPHWKIWVKLETFPNFPVNIKNIWVATSYVLQVNSFCLRFRRFPDNNSQRGITLSTDKDAATKQSNILKHAEAPAIVYRTSLHDISYTSQLYNYTITHTFSPSSSLNFLTAYFFSAPPDSHHRHSLREPVPLLRLPEEANRMLEWHKSHSPTSLHW